MGGRSGGNIAAECFIRSLPNITEWERTRDNTQGLIAGISAKKPCLLGLCDKIFPNKFRGVECKDEIYAAHQLACVKSEVKKKDDVDVVKDVESQTDKKVLTTPQRHRPISVTARLITTYEPPPAKEQQPPEVVVVPARPHTATRSIFAPRTEDMSKGFLTFSEEEPGLTMLKDEPDDLTHLAPVAGDVCVPLDDHPFLTDMLDDFLLKDSFGPLLTDEPSDPFMSFRDYRDSSPQLLSPNLSKNSDCSLPSLSSPNSSLLDEDQMSTFMNLQMDDDPDLIMKAPYIPMNFSDDLPLLITNNDLMWNDKGTKTRDSTGAGGGAGSALAQMLSDKRASLQSNDRGGKTADESNNKTSWSTKLSPKMEVDSIGQIDRSSGLKRSSNSYDHQQTTKRVKNEKMSSELLHQLMSNNHHHHHNQKSGGSRGKNKGNWLLESGGGKAACISQPSDSVLMNLLDTGHNAKTTEDDRQVSRPINFLARSKILQQQHQEKNRKEVETRRILIRKNSLSLLDPETTSVPSLLDLTQQDCEVNAPVNSSLLQGEELLIALDIAQNI